MLLLSKTNDAESLPILFSLYLLVLFCVEVAPSDAPAVNPDLVALVSTSFLW